MTQHAVEYVVVRTLGDDVGIVERFQTLMEADIRNYQLTECLKFYEDPKERHTTSLIKLDFTALGLPADRYEAQENWLAILHTMDPVLTAEMLDPDRVDKVRYSVMSVGGSTRDP